MDFAFFKSGVMVIIKLLAREAARAKQWQKE
jgi:hypothetical protein